jgi:hypothetical protein
MTMRQLKEEYLSKSVQKLEAEIKKLDVFPAKESNGSFWNDPAAKK